MRPSDKMYTGVVSWRWVFSSSLLLSSRRWTNFTDGALRAAKRVFCGLFGLVFPDDCRVCGQPLRAVSRIPVCSRCLKDPGPLNAEYFCIACRMPFLSRFPLDESGRCALCRLGYSGFDAVYSYGSYEGSLRKLIHLFKYGGVQPLARPFGDFLARALPREERFDRIVPMPLHWRRRFERRFNQSALLAREISKRWNVPVRAVVRRRRATAPQAGLTNAKRRANVAGAFRIKRGTRLDGMHILLVDDVLTTGASAAACARVLKRAGAARVTVLALARTDRRSAVIDLTVASRSASA
jgi:ComF family protein